MTATRKDIEGWLDKLYADDNLTHLIVACDTWDWDNYPVYVSEGEDVRKRAAECTSGDFGRVDEVYSRRHSRDEQMAEFRAVHYD